MRPKNYSFPRKTFVHLDRRTHKPLVTSSNLVAATTRPLSRSEVVFFVAFFLVFAASKEAHDQGRECPLVTQRKPSVAKIRLKLSVISPDCHFADSLSAFLVTWGLFLLRARAFLGGTTGTKP